MSFGRIPEKTFLKYTKDMERLDRALQVEDDALSGAGAFRQTTAESGLVQLYDYMRINLEYYKTIHMHTYICTCIYTGNLKADLKALISSLMDSGYYRGRLWFLCIYNVYI